MWITSSASCWLLLPEYAEIITNPKLPSGKYLLLETLLYISAFLWCPSYFTISTLSAAVIAGPKFNFPRTALAIGLTLLFGKFDDAVEVAAFLTKPSPSVLKSVWSYSCHLFFYKSQKHILESLFLVGKFCFPCFGTASREQKKKSSIMLEVIYDCWGFGCIGIRACLPSYCQIKTMTFWLHAAVVFFGREIHLTALTWKSTK